MIFYWIWLNKINWIFDSRNKIPNKSNEIFTPHLLNMLFKADKVSEPYRGSWQSKKGGNGVGKGQALYIFYTSFIIIRNIEMGCGAVCGIQTPTSNQHAIYSLAKIRQLSTRIKICPPLVSEAAYRQFSSLLEQGQNAYILRAGERVGTEEQIQVQIMQKWKILLYGLNKDEENYKSCVNFQVRNRKQQVTNSQNLISNSTIVNSKSYHQLKPNTQYHQCFTQIEKDLNRTFQFKQEKKKIFENILKRISNYFPSMGYTQGVNFVVGYLLIIGYSQSDTFWMFVHLALSERYLILGLYEDGFPLAYIYTTIFKSMLQRVDCQLHDHLYTNLMLDQSMWIFKWFITYYIYSFPFNTIKYIWNLVIELGGIALVYYALALVIHLRGQLLKIEDPCDISQFFQGLRDLSRFNSLIKINKIIEKVYEMKLTKQDLFGLQKMKPSFYQNYYSKILTDGANKKELYKWYQKIIRQRNQFKGHATQKPSQLSHLPQKLKNQYLDLQKSISVLQQRIFRNESIKLNNPIAQQEANYFQDLVIDQPIKIELKDKAQPQNEFQFKARNITKISYDMEESINEVDNQSDSNSSHTQQASYRMSGPIEEGNGNIKVVIKEEMNFALKVNTIIGQVDMRRNARQANIKASNIKIENNKRAGLALAGQNILCNLSVTNSHYSSSSSKNASFKPKKHKENNILRHHKIAKVKTQEVSQPSIDPSSSRQSSLDHQTDKQSFSGMTYRQNPHNQTILNDLNNDRRSQQDFMINSQGPHKINDPSKELASQVQLFNGNGLFKKKKVYNRNSNILSINQNIAKLNQNKDELQCYSKRTVNQHNLQLQYAHQESLDSIVYSYSKRKPSHLKKEIDSMKYEIQSIK